jgi:hypothetical protein
MRILAFSDVHGSYNRVVSMIAGASDIDLVVIAGDLTTCGDFREAEGAIKRLQARGIPLLMVSGNMDPPEVERAMDEAGVSLDGRGRVVGDTGLFGVSGAPYSPLHTPNEIPEEEILSRSLRGWVEVDGAVRKVFVPHAPPLGSRVDRLSSGKHVGSSAVAEVITRCNPALVICGHIHEARGEDRIGDTVVVNCGPVELGCAALITLGPSVVVERIPGGT